MIVITLSIAAGTMLIMALIFSFILGWANKRFKVAEDPKIEEVLNVLPGVNCGGCGYLGCSDYAVAIVTDNDPVNKCTVGGKSCAQNIADIMGVEVGEMVKVFAVVHCGAQREDRLKTHEYRGRLDVQPLTKSQDYRDVHMAASVLETAPEPVTIMLCTLRMAWQQ